MADPMPESNEVRAVLLAGASGTRFRPLSRLQAPKQFLRLIGQTLLDPTVERLAPLIDKSQVLVVSTEETATGKGYTVLEWVKWDRSKPDGTPRKRLDVSRMASLGWRVRTFMPDGIAIAHCDSVAGSQRPPASSDTRVARAAN